MPARDILSPPRIKLFRNKHKIERKKFKASKQEWWRPKHQVFSSHWRQVSCSPRLLFYKSINEINQNQKKRQIFGCFFYTLFKRGVEKRLWAPDGNGTLYSWHGLVSILGIQRFMANFLLSLVCTWKKGKHPRWRSPEIPAHAARHCINSCSSYQVTRYCADPM